MTNWKRKRNYNHCYDSPHFRALPPHSFLLVSIYLVLWGGPWSIWNWALYEEARMDQFALFYKLTSTWNSTICWKCWLFYTGLFLAPLSKNTWTYVCWLISSSSIPFHWSTCLSLYQYHAVFCFLFFFFNYNCSVIKLEVRECGSTRSSFIVENSLHYLRFFVIPNEFSNCCFFWDNPHSSSSGPAWRPSCKSITFKLRGLDPACVFF